MWNVWSKRLRGKSALRRFSLLATSFVLAIFATTTFLTNQAFAAEATRNSHDDTVSLDGKTYQRIDKQAFSNGPKTKDLPISQYDGYSFESSDKLFLILTDGDAKSAKEGQALNYTLKNGVYDPSTQNITDTKVTFTEQTFSNGGEDGYASSCSNPGLDNVGWIICPMTTFLANFMDWSLDWIKGALTIKTLHTNTSESPIYELWQKIRDLANICFVLVFLVIIYSQLTNLGVSNHSIKVMVPRLIIAAILVNLSYWIAGAAVDISNILGTGVQQFFTDVRKGLTGYDNLGSEISWGSLAGVVLAGGTLGRIAVVSAGGMAAALPGLVPAIVGGALAVAVAFIILAVRQAIVVVCILIAPLAFIAYILPSTNKLFDKWKDLFLTMLLVFPIISFVFGAAQLAGYAIIANAGDDIIQVIIGMTVQIAPLAITPLLMKVSGGLLGQIGAFVNDPNKGILDRTRNWAKERSEYAKNKSAAGAPLIDKKNGRFTNNWLTSKSERLKKAAERTADTMNKAHDTKTAGFISGRTAAQKQYRRKQRRQGLTGAYEAMAKNRATSWDDMTYRDSSARMLSGLGEVEKSEIDNNFQATDHGQRLESLRRHASARRSEIDNKFDRSSRGRAVNFRQQMADIDKTNVQTEFSSTSMGKRVDTAKRIAEREKQIVEKDLEKSWHTHNLRDSASQEREMVLRVRSDQAAAESLRVNAIYDDLKANVEGARIIDSKLNSAVEASIKQQAFDAAQLSAALSSRKLQSERELSVAINESIVSNGSTYQKDADGNIEVDAAGKPIVISKKQVVGVDIQDLAAGVGKKNIMLSREAAKQEKVEDEEVNAAFVLQKHFNFEATDWENLATKEGTVITKQDSSGNIMTFTFDDLSSRIAAEQWIARNGAYSQKEKLLVSSGTVNAGHSGAISRMLAENGFGKQAAWFNDIAINESSQGRIANEDDILFHTFRQILEGRQNAEKLSTNNDKVFSYIHRIFNDRLEGNDSWAEYKRRYVEWMRDHGKTDADIALFEAKAEDAFDVRYGDIIEYQEDIQTKPELSKLATGQVHKQIRKGLSEYAASSAGQSELARRVKLREATERIRKGEAYATDKDLVKRSHARYII